MIPHNITAENVREGLRPLLEEGYPERRESTRYDLLFDGERFPPKVAVSFANLVANGRKLPEQEFSGGVETNSFLSDLGFEIIPKSIDRENTWIFQSNPWWCKDTDAGRSCVRGLD